jgi:hypothetical protein
MFPGRRDDMLKHFVFFQQQLVAGRYEIGITIIVAHLDFSNWIDAIIIVVRSLSLKKEYC